MTNSRLFATKAEPEISSNSNQTRRNQDDKSETVMHSINLLVQKSGRVLPNDVKNLLGLLRTSDNINSGQALFTLRCCGSVLVDYPGAYRQRLADEVWSHIKGNQNFKMDISHYNTLLRVYLDNGTDFSPDTILTELATKELIPNRVTYQHLITKFCLDGNIIGATAILEHMKEMEMPVSEQVFHSLIYGHSKLGNFESAERVMMIMQDNALQIDPAAHSALLKGMITYGKTFDEVNDALEELKEKGINLNDQGYFDLIVAFIQNGQSEAARAIAEKLPRRSGYFNTMRNNIPKILENGDKELAISLLAQFEMPDKHSESGPEAEQREYGTFILRAMVNNNYSPQEIFETLEEMNKDEAIQARCVILLTNNFLMADRLKELGKFLEMAEEKLGKMAITRSEDFQRVLHIHIKKELDGPEECEKFLKDFHQKNSIVAIPLNVLSQTILPRIYNANRDDNGRLYSNFMDLMDKIDSRVNYQRIASATIQYGLRKNDPKFFNEVGMFLHFGKGSLYSPMTWRNELARNYLMTENLDVLKAALMLQSNVYQKMVKPNSNYVESDGSLYQALVTIHQDTHRNSISDKTPAEVLETVLKDLEESKFGVPPKIVEELSKIIENPDLKKTLENLAKNYENFDQIWSLESLNEFAEANKKAILRNLPKSEIPVQRRTRGYSPLKDQMEKVEQHLEDGNTKDALKLLDKIKEKFQRPNIKISYVGLDKYAKKRFEDLPNEPFEKVMDKILDELSLEMDAPSTFYISTLMNIAITLIIRGQRDDSIKALEFIRDKNHMFVPKEKRDLQDEFSYFTRQLSGHLQDMEFTHKIAKIQSEILGSSQEGLMVKFLLDSGESEAALVKFEELAKETKFCHFLPQLVQEFTINEDKERMQRLLNATVSVKREEGALYDFGRIFLEMGRIPQARKLLGAPGLRYNDTIVKGICNRLERTSPNALEEFVKLCIPLFASDQDFLFGKLIDCVSNDPEKVEDVWVSMQEANFIPNDSLLRKLAGNLKSHGLDVPFQVEDEPEISAPKPNKKQKAKKPKQEQGEIPKQEQEEEPKQEKRPKSNEGEELRNKAKAEIAHNFGLEIAKQDLEGAVTILLQALKSKKANREMIYDTVQLMINKNDFSRLDEIGQSVSRAIPIFRGFFRGSLESVPIEILENVKMSDKEEKLLLWKTYVTSRVAKNCTNLQSLFDKIKTEDFGHLRSNAMAHLVSNEDSAKAIVDKVNETKDIVQNMGMDPLILATFSSNAFILLAIKGQDSSALKLHKDFESVLDSKTLKMFSDSQDGNLKESRDIYNSFLKKHDIKLKVEE